MSFQKLREIELILIFQNLDIYDQVVFHRVNQRWKKLIQKYMLPKYLQQNYPTMYEKYDSYMEHSRMLLEMLPHEEPDLCIGQFDISIQFFERQYGEAKEKKLILGEKHDDIRLGSESMFRLGLNSHQILKNYKYNFVKVVIGYKKFRKWRFRVLRLDRYHWNENGSEVHFRSQKPIWKDEYFWFTGSVCEEPEEDTEDALYMTHFGLKDDYHIHSEEYHIRLTDLFE